MTLSHRIASVISACVIALGASGCGGGGSSGGGGPNPTPTPPTGPSPNLNDSEYQASNSATTASALSAYQAGAAGNGVKVAVIDTGINPDLPEFAGRIDPASQDVAADRGIVDHQNHGTMVSGVLAANRDGQYMQGVAYQATILSLNVYDPAGCKPGNDCFLDSALPTAIDLARTNGAKIINMSFGDEEGMTPEIWGAIQRAVDAGIVMVMSAGNAGIADPNSFAVTNIQNNGGSGLFVIAGAMDSNRNIANFSNRAGTGIGAQHYLTALGVGNATVNRLGQHVAPNGTSFSAPTIAGAAALLAGAFPNLSGAQIVNLLLSTADDAGVAGTDATFGRGILNVSKAFQPQGATTLAGSDVKVAVSGNGTLSGAMGDAAMGNSGGAVILDGYSRAYAVNFARTLVQAPKDQPLYQALGGGFVRNAGASAGPLAVSISVRHDGLAPMVERSAFAMGPDARRQAKSIAGLALARLSPKVALAMGFSQSGRALQRQLAGHSENAFLVASDPADRMGFHSAPHSSVGLRRTFGSGGVTLSSERGRAAVAALVREPQWPSYRLDSAAFDWTAGGAKLAFGFSRLREQDTVLGARFSDLFAGGGGRTFFLDASARRDFGRGWTGFAAYRRGWTQVSGGALAGRGRLSTGAFAVDIAKQGLALADDKLGLRIVQPLRVSSGGFGLNVPVGYDYETGIATYGRNFLNLAPSGREVDYELAYGRAAFGGFLDLNAFIRTQPGHIRSARPDAGAAIRLTVK